jgi:hypothetical protein
MTSINISNGVIYPHSITQHYGDIYFVVKMDDGARYLGIQGNSDGFFDVLVRDNGIALVPLTPENAVEIRRRIEWLSPVPLGKQKSVGFGDRLAAATPGHIAAIRACDAAGVMSPIFAQQSVRENTRTGRTPQIVMDAAMWAILQEGWTEPWGADADHVKVAPDVAPFVAAGYTFYAIDPSDYVDNAANTEPEDVLRKKVEKLPWDVLDSSLDDMISRYLAAPIALDELVLAFDEATLLRGLAKYGHALAHTFTLAAVIAEQMGGKPFDLEMSIDETDTPTSIHEHYFIVNELTRAGVPIVSVAPRFVGKFQKGVDYIGDTAVFEESLAEHAAIMRHFGTYKMSIHTGSDKFSIYPIIAEHTQNFAHVKTAGTSYLEALRLMSKLKPELFKKALDLAHERFQKDRKSYYLDCEQDKVPKSDQLSDEALPGLMEEFNARQLLHVTFGSILDVFGNELHAMLDEYEQEYRDLLSAHFQRHITPFM